MSTDGALNINGLVLEGSGDYLEDAQHNAFQRGDTRLVYDLPDDMVRMAAGDLSYPVEGFQSFQPMLGLTLARNFDLQPYRVSEPTGQTSFFLNSPSRVEVYVNDRRVQTLRLDSGPYDIRDFPVVGGSNDVRLVITDASGRVEVRNMSIVSDADLLAAGLHKYAYNLGVVSTTSERKKIYDEDKPVLSVFHRYGFNDSLTLGANLQASTEQHMGGIEATLGSDLGIFRTDIAMSGIDGGDSGMAWQGQYQYIDHAEIVDGKFDGANIFTLLATYRDRRFASLGTLAPDNHNAYDFTARYSQQISPTMNIGIGQRYEMGRGEQKDDWTTSLNMDKVLPKGFRMGVNLERRKDDGYGIFFNITWTPRSSRHFVSSSYDSFTHTTRADWNYAQDTRTESFNATAGVVRNDDSEEGTGSLTYFGNRGEITARHDISNTFGDGMVSGTESRSQLQFGTALAMSDGHIAVSRPIAGSFAMIKPHKAINKYPLGIDPQSTDDEPTYEAKADFFGPAVLPELTPYVYRTIRVDTSRLPAGFDAGENAYTLHPGYHSGTFIEIGSDTNVLLDGTLHYHDGTPVALLAGSIHPFAASELSDTPFFTNREGRFRIEKMSPGDYTMTLYRFPGIQVEFSIPDGAAGPTKVGLITIPIVPNAEVFAPKGWEYNSNTEDKITDIPEPSIAHESEVKPVKLYTVPTDTSTQPYAPVFPVETRQLLAPEPEEIP